MTAVEKELLAGRFEIDREVGRGAAGVVYRAHDAALGQTVALKVIADTNGAGDEYERFLREGEILGGIIHPGIVRVVSYGSLERGYTDADGRRFTQGTPFVAMEWLEGEDLAARQKRSPLALRQAVEVIRQVSDALASAHDHGVVHRDIKPSNIFLSYENGTPGRASPVSSYGTLRPGSRIEGAEPADKATTSDETLNAKLLDFGVAAANDLQLTGAGAIVGTPAYMAPEQAQGDAAPDVRSDIYSLGATLFELCAGRPPHIGPTSIATLARRVTGPAPRLSDLLVEIPRELDDLVHRMLEFEPQKRPATAHEVASALGLWLADQGVAKSVKLLLREEDSRERLGTRLVTTLVALHVASGEDRQRIIEELKSQDADALPLGTDSIVAHLGARRAHGDEAARALEIGVDLAERGARVGIATGRTRVDLTRSSGDIVDRAAKLARDAGDGKLAADATTTEISRGRFEVDVPSFAESAALSTFRKISRLSAAMSAATFVGRDAELISTLDAYERCVDDHTPIIVSISGPPGIGKSRLGREVVLRVETRGERGGMMLVRCESYAQAQALGVATDALRSLVALPKGASLEQARAAIAARGSRDEHDLLARLLSNQPLLEGMEPAAARDALYVSMTDIVLDSTANGSCVLIVEDAQWSDPESIAWIDHLLGRGLGRGLFVLLLVRPQFWRREPQRFSGRDHVRLELRPMARRATREIARSIIGPKATEEQLDKVAEQAAGSPLFAEELARMVAAGKSPDNAATIEAAIQVSLDALDDAARSAVVRMSVLGLSVWDAGAARLGVTAQDATLAKLVAAEILVEQPKSRFAGTHEYLFKHGLIRDVAYAMGGDGLKKELHGLAAEWLNEVGEDAATIAQHFDLGGRNQEAAVHWEAAARRALATNSLADAATMAERALAFADDKPTAFARAIILEEAHARLDARSSERDSAIRAMRENVFDEASELRTDGALARYDDARAAGMDIEGRLTFVRDRANAIGLTEESARCSATLAQRHAYGGQLAQAEAEAAQLLELTEVKNIVWAAVDAWQTLAIVRQTRGELAAALDARRNAARAARAAGLQEREATLTMNLGFALTTIGAKQEALFEIETGLGKAQAVGSAFGVRHGQMILLCWAATFGAEARLESSLAEPRANADDAASGGWILQDRTTLGVMFYRGAELLRSEGAALSRARGLLERVAHAYRSTGNLDLLPVALGLWAEAERRLGDPEHARELAGEAAALLEGGAPSLLNEAPVYLALHDAYVDSGDLRSARNAMERGMPLFLRRLKGLEDTAYARSFLTSLPHNAALLAAAEAYGLVPETLNAITRRHDV